MRHLEKGAAPIAADGAVIVFASYQEAGPFLKARIGRYCCYCERVVPVSLAVEHKLPRTHHPHLALTWSNFLLACANCNSAKGHNDTATMALIWPDEEDTYSTIEYDRSGAVRPIAGLSEALAARVLNLLKLTGLATTPRETSSSDHRFFDRLEVWRKAEQLAADLAEYNTAQMRAAILEVAKSSGGFSIWMKAFVHDEQMQTDLRSAFPGTAAAAQRQD